ncbi:transcriptional accessory protein [Encephalitozoon intestinalis ATCC 50506]|uniref:Transcriptional accessory protein n=1 Tax=Encephalitozoon intestinalis (strain ATCC 50506) TaxID=876142 RepID=E0S890_ENCIT|nr:transcriptional accessory protein [Encephalitozoon intestinalis ATCC 50506]ADM11925.1 transcriptional accessory protein [Encephalitozoon intestinalis ATCC 50506]UTX45683.1 SH2 domain-containing protein [Encephalitozoon intestinalis]
MNDSSSEEMININRRGNQTVRKRILEDLFEEDQHEASSESISSIDYEDRNSLFYEIFGTGDEYRYILEDENSESTEETNSGNVNALEYDPIDLDGVCEYAMNNMEIKPESLRKVIELLGKGYSIHFVLLHNGIEGISIEEGYKIVDIFDEYKEFANSKKRVEERYGSDPLFQSIKDIRALRWYYGYKKHLGKNLDLPGELLSAEEFCENIRTKKKIHEPLDSSSFPRFEEEGELIQRISLHPIFRSALEVIFKSYGVRNERNELEVRDEIIKRDLIDFYLSDISSEDPWNRYRESIVRSSVEKVSKEVVIPSILKKMEAEAMKKEIFLETIDRIVNGSIGIKGDGTYVCGVTKEKKYLKAVAVDFEGDLVDSITVKEDEENELLGFIEKFNPCCIAVSGFTTSIRYLMKTLSSWNPLYVEGRIAQMKSQDTYSFCCNIARIIQCPEIEYSDMLNKNIIYIQGLLPRNVIIETIKRGILTAISVVGVDANYLLNNKRKEGLISLIPVSNASKNNLFSLKNVAKLEDLKSLCENEVEYDNLTTYLRIYPGVFSGVSGGEPLDSTPVHPKNYSVARKLCGNTWKRELDNEKASAPSIPECSDPLAMDVYRALEDGERPIYSGFPDHLIFEELTGSNGSLVGKVIEGRISKCGNTYYLVSSDSTPASIYVRKTKGQEEFFLNQLVTVKIEYMNDYLLSYTASFTISGPKKPHHSRFMTHPLFKDLNSEESEKYLKKNSSSILLRRSRKDGTPVVVLRVTDSIYVHIKIQEAEKYYYKGNSYDDLDELISRVAKKMLTNVKNIKNHKYYFEDEEKLLDYLNQGGSYIRYGFFFSEKYPGKLCMMYRNGRNYKEYITVDDNLVYEGKSFENLDEFIKYRKSL